MKLLRVWLVLCIGTSFAGPQENPLDKPGKGVNPLAVPPAVPMQELRPVEKKMYARMLGEREKIQKRFPMRVIIEEIHATGERKEASKWFMVSFVVGAVKTLHGISNQTAELKARADWYDKNETFSLYCSSETGNCAQLVPGTYFARKTRVFVARVSRRRPGVEIPVVIADSINIGGIYMEKTVVLTYQILPFDPNRFRK